MIDLRDYIPALRYGAGITINTLSPDVSTDEWNSISMASTPVTTYLTGTNLLWSSSRGSAAIKLDNTFAQVSGGLHNIYSRITSNGVFTTDGNGVVNLKIVTVNSAAITDGEMYGGQFIVKKTGAGTALAASSHIAVEGWFLETDSGVIRTGIGGNFGWHTDSTAAAHGAGSVHRGIQIFCDNGGTSAAEESTGLCIWNQTGTITNALNVVNSGSGFTNFAKFTDDGVPAQSTGTRTTESGWIKVLIGSEVRYIRLYTT